jgi:DNA replication protein DnaC
MKVMKAKTTDQTTPLRDRCLSHFVALRIPIEAAVLDELLSRAEKESFSHLSFLDRLLGAEAGARRERAVARRIREARFADNKTMEGFDWTFNPKTFDRVQLSGTQKCLRTRPISGRAFSLQCLRALMARIPAMPLSSWNLRTGGIYHDGRIAAG